MSHEEMFEQVRAISNRLTEANLMVSELEIALARILDLEEQENEYKGKSLEVPRADLTPIRIKL